MNDHRSKRFTRHYRRPAPTRCQVRQHVGQLRDLHQVKGFLDDLHDAFLGEMTTSIEEEL